MRQNKWAPMGRQIQQALQSKETAFIEANGAQIQQLTERSIDSLIGLGVIAAYGTAATAGATGAIGAGAAAEGTGLAARGAGMASLLTPAATIAATLAASLAIGVAAYVAQPHMTPAETEPAGIVQSVNIQTEGNIMFTGSITGFEHVNPRRATVEAENENGALAARMWWITEAATEDVLYRGTDEEVDHVFTEMIEGGRAGHYVLNYLMVDAEGYSFELSRRFIIVSEKN